MVVAHLLKVFEDEGVKRGCVLLHHRHVAVINWHHAVLWERCWERWVDDEEVVELFVTHRGGGVDEGEIEVVLVVEKQICEKWVRLLHCGGEVGIVGVQEVLVFDLVVLDEGVVGDLFVLVRVVVVHVLINQHQ